MKPMNTTKATAKQISFTKRAIATLNPGGLRDHLSQMAESAALLSGVACGI